MEKIGFKGLGHYREWEPLFENIKDEPEFQRLVAIAKEKVRLKRDEVRISRDPHKPGSD